MHRISGWPDIRPDDPAFFDIRYPAGYQIALPDIRPDNRISGRITGYPAGYPANDKLIQRFI
jgi:hypothetical protein